VEQQVSGTSVRLQAVSAVDERIVWASGLEGTYVRSTDGGATWTAGLVPNADSLQFRDVDAFDSSTAYLLSAGPGEASRIYKTADGGASWELQFVNTEPEGFFDCMAFWDATSGMAFSDAVDGEFIVITTANGNDWERVPAASLPDALPGEGSFAASGTCLTTQGDSTAWFGTGASEMARVFKTSDRGRTWSVHETPMVSGSMSGITSIAFRNRLNGIIAGGRIGRPADFSDNVAVTRDGGHTWTLVGRPTFTGAIYGLNYVKGSLRTVVAVGPNGAAYSTDEGGTWTPLDSLDYWSVAFAGSDAGWLVGPRGRITKAVGF
jgi:photosystem II stability/assembly factor-like uncharacterized protein